jgi:hypothetical protein
LITSSSDALPAFLWRKPVGKGKVFVLRMKSVAGARPLFGLRMTGKEGTQLGYMDPVWRSGFAALCWQDNLHTAGAFRFEWKADTWYDFVLEIGHWHKWQIIEVDNPKNYAAFVADLFSENGELSLGIGAAGKGSVTVQGMLVK